MTKLPKKVMVGGNWWRIERPKFGDLATDTRVGEADHMSRTISVVREVEGEYAWLTFYHEYRHAWQFENGWMQVLDTQARELDCEQFATMMVSLVRQGMIVPKKFLK